MTGTNQKAEKDDESLEEVENEDMSFSGSDDSGEDTEGSPRFWTEEEDKALKTAVDMYGKKNWKNIAAVVPSRTHVQCLQRWNKVLRPGLVKGSWSEEEDKILRDAVLKSGARTSKDNWKCNWSQISELVPGRTAKQCRERWRCNLDPDINKSEWSEAEDKILLDLQASIGNRWALIAKSLPGRTENAIKTRFRSIQRAKRKEWSPEEDRIILEMRTQKGCRWETISAALPNRTKNGVKVRHKQLMQEQYAKNSDKLSKRKRKSQEMDGNNPAASNGDQNGVKTEKLKLSRHSSSSTGKTTSSESESDQGETQTRKSTSSQAVTPQTSDPNIFKSLAQIYPSNAAFFYTPYGVVGGFAVPTDPLKEAECRAATTLLNMAGVLPKSGDINNSFQGFQLLHA